MAIPFTQYLRPNGRPVSVTIERGGAVEQMARDLIAAGYHFEIEELTTGDVHMDAWAPSDEDFPVADELCTNGPEMCGAVDRLIREAHAHLSSAEPREAPSEVPPVGTSDAP